MKNSLGSILVRSFDIELLRKVSKKVEFTQKVSVHWGLQLGLYLSCHPTCQTGQFWVGQKLLENAKFHESKNETFLGNFQTVWSYQF